ncbi:MAG TPA: glycosyltransferase [Mycobacteriales bacterium]|nr:glycosyltransferase [Mycobacteriales bacterium]
MTQVDVLLPVRDGGKMLLPAVESVLMQTGVALHLWVIDDGSVDGAPERLPEDSRLTVLRTGGAGVVRALEQGFAAGVAPLVARQDADDVSLPDRLRRQVQHLDAHPEIGLVGTAFEILVGASVVGICADGPWNALERNPFCAGSILVRREVWRAAGGVREVPNAEDYDLWLRCAEIAGVSILAEPGYRYRVHAGMASLRWAGRSARAAAAVQAAARARLAGLPDPLRLGLQLPEQPEDPEVLAWWAREFAALGAEKDAALCRRTLGPEFDVAPPLQPQASWS